MASHPLGENSITRAALELRLAIGQGRLPRINPRPRLPYIHPITRISANRTMGDALLLWLDYHHDYWTYGDTQHTAPEGVLNPRSPYYGHSYDNNPFSPTFRQRNR